MAEREHQQTQQPFLALVRSVRGQMAALVANLSLRVSPPVAHTVNAKQPKRSKPERPWRVVEDSQLGEHPPLEAFRPSPQSTSSDRQGDQTNR